MHINIDNIKKLPNEEKLRIIDEIWESIEEGWEKATQNHEESGEINNLLEERLAAYEKGETKSYSWKEVEDRIRNNLEGKKNEKK